MHVLTQDRRLRNTALEIALLKGFAHCFHLARAHLLPDGLLCQPQPHARTHVPVHAPVHTHARGCTPTHLRSALARCGHACYRLLCHFAVALGPRQLPLDDQRTWGSFFADGPIFVPVPDGFTELYTRVG
jgi:hypothetical protein